MSKNKDIIVVSGLPRSGTSMMMQMLRAGGITLITDEKRPADEHNPYGYFEFEKVKDLEQDNKWLNDHQGKAIKILFHLLKFLPGNLSYKIIFIQRDLNNVLNSQNKMLQGYGKPLQDKNIVNSIFEKASQEIEQWIKKQKNMQVLFINYADVLNKPDGNAEKLKTFLARGLNTKKMTTAVSPNVSPK